MKKFADTSIKTENDTIFVPIDMLHKTKNRFADENMASCVKKFELIVLTTATSGHFTDRYPLILTAVQS